MSLPGRKAGRWRLLHRLWLALRAAGIAVALTALLLGVAGVALFADEDLLAPWSARATPSPAARRGEPAEGKPRDARAPAPVGGDEGTVPPELVDVQRSAPTPEVASAPAVQRASARADRPRVELPGIVAEVVDPVTLRLRSGETVELAGVAGPRDQPLVHEATRFLAQLLVGREVSVRPCPADGPPSTPGERRVTGLVEFSGTNLNRRLLMEGWAVVAETPGCALDLSQWGSYEAAGRERRAGIWARGGPPATAPPAAAPGSAPQTGTRGR